MDRVKINLEQARLCRGATGEIDDGLGGLRCRCLVLPGLAWYVLSGGVE